jgi:hypothetical protein
MYTAPRLLVVRYLAQALLTSANSASMPEAGFRVGLEIVFFTKAFFSSGYRLSEPTILCRIGEIVGVGGASATDPTEALGSIGLAIMFSMDFVFAAIWFGELRTFDIRRTSVAALSDHFECCGKPGDFAMP